MIEHSAQSITLDAIREHYNALAPLYRRFWGEHIHHGFWENGETLPEAQLKLIEKLAASAMLRRGTHVLDVGCGTGGSAIWLARELGCTVRGITLSATQAELANQRAAQAGLSREVIFEVRDANRLEAFGESFDAIWIVECSEHIFDKPKFFETCFHLLRPGGRLALCAWLAEPANATHTRLVSDVCHAMLCPSLGSMSDHVAWLRASGFATVRARDITSQVAPTWTQAAAVLARPEVAPLLRAASIEVRRFTGAFASMRDAYAVGAMGYGLFCASKSET